MNAIPLWIVCFGLGAGDALLTGLVGVVFGGLFFVLCLPLVIRGDRRSALSGLLTGFGGTWLALLGVQASTGGELANSTPWIALGAVPLVLGLALLIARRSRHAHPATL